MRQMGRHMAAGKGFPPRDGGAPDDPERTDAELRRAFGSRLRVVKRHAPLVNPGDRERSIFLLASGWACRERQLPDGDRVVLDLYLAGDLIGLDQLFTQDASDSIVALTPAGYLSLEREAFKRFLMQQPAVSLHLVQLIIEERRRLDESRIQLARLNAVERAAAFLLNVYDRLERRSIKGPRGVRERRGGRVEFAFPLTQQRLAEYLGLHPIHVNRTLRTLRINGIAIIESGVVTIQDMKLLKDTARARGSLDID
jgi:CRP/FNR family transcriptional regulator